MKPSIAVVTGERKPLAYLQYTVTSTAVYLNTLAKWPKTPTGIGIPVGYAVIQCNAGAIRWRDDQVAPTSSVGMNLTAGGELDYAGDAGQLQVITASASPVLDITLYA